MNWSENCCFCYFLPRVGHYFWNRLVYLMDYYCRRFMCRTDYYMWIFLRFIKMYCFVCRSILYIWNWCYVGIFLVLLLFLRQNWLLRFWQIKKVCLSSHYVLLPLLCCYFLLLWVLVLISSFRQMKELCLSSHHTSSITTDKDAATLSLNGKCVKVRHINNPRQKEECVSECVLE